MRTETGIISLLVGVTFGSICLLILLLADEGQPAPKRPRLQKVIYAEEPVQKHTMHSVTQLPTLPVPPKTKEKEIKDHILRNPGKPAPKGYIFKGKLPNGTVKTIERNQSFYPKEYK